MHALFHRTITLSLVAATSLLLANAALGEPKAEAKAEKAGKAGKAGKAVEAATMTGAGGAPKAAPRKGGRQGQGMRGGRPHPRRQRGFPAGLAEARLVKESAKQLGLSEDVLTKLGELTKAYRAEEDRLTEDMRQATSKVTELLDKARPDKQALTEASQSASEIGRQTRLARLHLTLEVRSLLDDEQIAKFMELRTKAMESRAKRGGRRQEQSPGAPLDLHAPEVDAAK